MKRIVASLLILILLLSGCCAAPQDGLEETLAQDWEQRVILPAPAPAPEKEPEPPEESTPAPEQPKEEKADPPAEKEPAPVRELRLEDTPVLEEKVQIYTAHSALSEAEYYQFSTLSAAEQQIYAQISAVIEAGKGKLDLRGQSCSVERAKAIFAAFIADHPQCFYLYGSFVYTQSAEDQTVKELVVQYFDGKVHDTYSEQGEQLVMADRTKIAAQIRAFNRRNQQVLEALPADAGKVEKEKYFYDLIQDTVTYDRTTADGAAEAEAVESHAFDAYGAACEGLSVCEGYAEWFQYLCCSVGILATPVNGSVGEELHMWTALLLESGWYMADVTWDDADMEGYRCYQYFNVTKEQLAASHTVDTASLAVPACTASEEAFFRVFALAPAAGDALPENYREVLDRLAKSGDFWLYLYLPQWSEQEVEAYLQRYFIAPYSEIRRYIREQGYEISFEPAYYINGDYCALALKGGSQ